MRVEINGVGIEFDVTGPEAGPAVVLLHGFPDTARLWRHQIPVLSAAGFRVIAPDLRGAGRSDKPASVDAYGGALIAADILGLLDTLNIAEAHIVGHDAGAAIAWSLAAAAAERVDRLVVLSVGHPTAYASAGFAQKEKAWYQLMFICAGVAEQWLSGNDWAGFRAFLRHPDADAVIADLERRGSLTPMLNWYRANITPESFVGPAPELPMVQAPTMGVWATGDFYVLEDQMTASVRYVAGPWRYERIEDAGHWMPLDAPNEVNHLLIDFLRS